LRTCAWGNPRPKRKVNKFQRKHIIFDWRLHNQQYKVDFRFPFAVDFPPLGSPHLTAQSGVCVLGRDDCRQNTDGLIRWVVRSVVRIALHAHCCFL
jgi:hypothetical protein